MESKILKRKLKTLETDAMNVLKIMDFEININARYSIFQDNMGMLPKPRKMLILLKLGNDKFVLYMQE